MLAALSGDVKPSEAPMWGQKPQDKISACADDLVFYITLFFHLSYVWFLT